MNSCTFFGHRDTTYKVKPYVKEAIINVFLQRQVNTFYVGNN